MEGALGVSSQEFKGVLARWATGVTIVTSFESERVHGMTVSAFTEVSLDPPLVLICADAQANTVPFIQASGAFGINILARDQEALSNRFASKRDEWQRFRDVDYRRGPTGSPLLSGAVATLDCRVVACHEHGDHLVFVGAVEQASHGESPPLLYYTGSYGDFSP